MLGRAGHSLTNEELDTLSKELGHFHKQYHSIRGHDADRALTEWYATSGQDRTIPIYRLLSVCEAVENILNMPAYIAAALTGKIPPGYKENIDEDEWSDIKHHLDIT